MKTSRRHWGLMAAVSVLLTLTAGCGPDDPYSKPGGPERKDSPASPSPASGSGRVGEPPTRGELPRTVPKGLAERDPVRFPGAATTPKGTLRVATGLYGNWTSATAPRAFRRLAGISVGEARAQLRQVAAQSGIDAQQRGVRSRSRVVSLRITGTGESRAGTVVTRDIVIGPGLPDTGARYQVTRAVLVKRRDRWVIARWEPQP